VPRSTTDALADLLRAVGQFARNCGQIKRDDAAKKLWAEVYPRLSEGFPGLVGAATSRAEAQVLRLSAIFAVLDMSETIRVEHLHAALAVWDYAFDSARYIR
jgi:hypothetical protein